MMSFSYSTQFAPESGKRDQMMSIAKGIGIVLMVIGHAGAPKALWNFLYLFHMPLFFFISGYFFRNSENSTELRQRLKKRFRRLYLPFVSWNLLFLLLHNPLFRLGFYNEEFGGNSIFTLNQIGANILKIFLKMEGSESILGATWFLRALLAAVIIVEVLSFLLRKKEKSEWYLLCVIIVGLIISLTLDSLLNINALRYITLFFMSALYFTIGYIFKKHKSYFSLNWVCMLLLFIITLTFSIMYDKHLSITIISLEKVNPLTILLYLIISIIGILFILSLSKILTNSSVGKTFSYCGERTMSILLLHLSAFRLVNWLKIELFGLPKGMIDCFPIISQHNDWFWLAYTIIGIVIPLIFDLFKNKTKTILSRKNQPPLFFG